MKNTNTQKANANHINGNCKGVRCLTDGKFYPGMKFAAKEANVSSSSMSYAIKHKTLCKGKRYAWESETEENVMEMGRQLSEMEMLRAKANAYDMLMLEQKAKEEAEAKRLEAERKAEEKRQAEITKLEDKIERLETLIDRKTDERQKLVDKRNEALAELKALMDNGKEVV
jgi:DNA repair exonuclease SbcCD ATPase subunit